ncbi:MAG: heavy metal-binding domain-containing protein, partial [Acidimicrobiales bacterium]
MSADQSALATEAVEHLRTAHEGFGDPFSSDLSVDEAILVDKAGFEIKGLVSGAAVFQIGLVGRSWKTNAEVAELSSVMYDAREAALTRMSRAAGETESDGVVGVRLHIQSFESLTRTVQFVAFGTAISQRAKIKTGPKRPFFTSDLSGKDFYLLTQAGYWPLGLAMGCCVYHVAHRKFGQWVKSQT